MLVVQTSVGIQSIGSEAGQGRANQQQPNGGGETASTLMRDLLVCECGVGWWLVATNEWQEIESRDRV